MVFQTKNQIKRFFKQLFSILNCHVASLRVNLFNFKNDFKYAVPPNYATTPQAVKLRKKRPFMASFSKK